MIYMDRQWWELAGRPPGEMRDTDRWEIKVREEDFERYTGMSYRSWSDWVKTDPQCECGHELSFHSPGCVVGVFDSVTQTHSPCECRTWKP
jgi:hypothetical protein